MTLYFSHTFLWHLIKNKMSMGAIDFRLLQGLLFSEFLRCYTGWPRKNATLTINTFKQTRDRMKKVVCIVAYKILFPARWHQHDQDRKFFMKAFWFNCRFSEAMSFSRLALLSQKSQFTYRKFSFVWLPRVKCLLLLCKAKPAWIKRSIHYVTSQHYNPGELLKQIPPYLKHDFWYKRSKFWKWHCLRKNGSRIKTPTSK